MAQTVQFLGPDGKPGDAFHNNCGKQVTGTRAASGSIVECPTHGIVRHRDISVKPKR